ncbi:MAG: hypothetical protein U9P72_01035 [Campylobacterota bacterium]|nr:hypothetical protein [Campylobacterota bacterium]
MELKDVILSTLAEMEDPPTHQEPKISEAKAKKVEEKVEEKIISKDLENEIVVDDSKIDSELIYLNSIKERLLVLFEGFQAPNNSNIEAKVDMTLNYLEYVLATISNRIEILEKGDANERI